MQKELQPFRDNELFQKIITSSIWNLWATKNTNIIENQIGLEKLHQEFYDTAKNFTETFMKF